MEKVTTTRSFTIPPELSRDWIKWVDNVKNSPQRKILNWHLFLIADII